MDELTSKIQALETNRRKLYDFFAQRSGNFTREINTENFAAELQEELGYQPYSAKYESAFYLAYGIRTTSKDLEKPDFDLKHGINLDSYALKQEQASLERVLKITGLDLFLATNTEIRHAAIKMFTMPWPELNAAYATFGIDTGADNKGSSNAVFDTQILLGLLNNAGAPVAFDELKAGFMQSNSDLGYFEKTYKAQVDFAFDKIQNPLAISDSPEHYWHLHCNIQDIYDRQQEHHVAHVAFGANLVKMQSTISPSPLEPFTVHLGIIPYSISFIDDDHIAVLGALNFSDDEVQREDLSEGTLKLAKIRIPDGAEVTRVETSIDAVLRGAAGMAFDFGSKVRRGSDGTIYVTRSLDHIADDGMLIGSHNGYIGRRHSENTLPADVSSFVNLYRFTSKLEPASPDKNLNGFLKIVGAEFNLPSDFSIFSIAEQNGTFFMALGPQNDPGRGAWFVTGTAERITEMGEYHVATGLTGGGFDTLPELAIHNDVIYLKMSNSVGWNRFDAQTGKLQGNWRYLIDKESIRHGCHPSKIAVAPDGTLYAFTQMKDEPAYSVKGYIVADDGPKFTVHIYPESYPDHWPLLRDIAINSKGIMAISCVGERSLHLYQLDLTHDAKYLKP